MALLDLGLLRATSNMGVRRAYELCQDIKAWEEANPLGIAFIEEHGTWTGVAQADPQIPRDFSVRLAECLHHMATALDHVAWALVSEDTRRQKKARSKVQMPACVEEEHWPGALGAALRGIDPRMAEFIRERQPFRRAERTGQPAWTFAPALLRKIDNAHKHRGLHYFQREVSGPPTFAVDSQDERVEVIARTAGLVAPGDVVMTVTPVEGNSHDVGLPTTLCFVVGEETTGKDPTKDGLSERFPAADIQRLVLDLSNEVGWYVNEARRLDLLT